MVERADVACEQNGRSRGYGLVIMKSKEAAEDAIGKHGHTRVEVLDFQKSFRRMRYRGARSWLKWTKARLDGSRTVLSLCL